MSHSQGSEKQSVVGEEHVKAVPLSAATDTAESKESEIQDVSDPDEDDLDDLDGMN